MPAMHDRDPAGLLRMALRHTGGTFTRLSERDVSSGLHEVREFGPALRESLVCAGVPPDPVGLNRSVELAH
jgi:hypothetical protein